MTDDEREQLRKIDEDFERQRAKWNAQWMQIRNRLQALDERMEASRRASLGWPYVFQPRQGSKN